MARNPALLDLEEQRKALVPEADPPFVLPVPVLPPDDPDAAPLPPPAPPPGKPLDAYTPAALYGAGADRAALEAAIANRGKQDQAADFMDAASLFNRAGGGHAGDLAAPVRQHRDDAFNDVMRRRALADQDAQATDRARKAAMAAAMEDPGSELSQKALGFYGASTIGKEMMNRLPPEMRARLTASMVPGGKDILDSETDLYKAGLKANAANKADGREETLAALVAAAGGPDSPRGQWFAQTFAQAPFQVIKEAGFGMLNHEEQRKYQSTENEKTRNAMFGRWGAQQTTDQANKRVQRLQDLGNQIKPEFSSGVSAVNALIPLVEKLDKQYGGDIPGTGLVNSVAADSFPKLTTMVQGKMGKSGADASEFQGLMKMAEVLGRKDITGSAFSAKEGAQIQYLLGNIVNGRSVKQSLSRLKLITHSALDRVYASHPEVWREFVKQNPDLQTDRFRVDSPAQATEAPINPVPLSPEQAAAMGVDPGLIPEPPAVPASIPVREPSGAPAAETPSSGPVAPVVKTFRNKVTGALQKFRVYPDGRKEPVDE
jgi:hypothetical protein